MIISAVFTSDVLVTELPLSIANHRQHSDLQKSPGSKAIF